MLADSSISNLQLITRELLSMHHQADPSLSKEFDVSLFSFFFPHITATLMKLSSRQFELCVCACVCVASVPPTGGWTLNIRVRGSEEWRGDLLHECRLSATLHAARLT